MIARLFVVSDTSIWSETYMNDYVLIITMFGWISFIIAT